MILRIQDECRFWLCFRVELGQEQALCLVQASDIEVLKARSMMHGCQIQINSTWEKAQTEQILKY